MSDANGPASTPDADAGEGTDAGAQADADAAPPMDNGAPSSTFPAPHAPARALVKLPGPVLAHPTVIPVFFGDDKDRARTESVLASLVGSDYWKNLAEYGVGDIAVGASVVLADKAPATFSLDGIDSVVEGLWLRDVAPAPKPDGTQIYALFFPVQTQVVQVDGSPFCDAGGAYHDSRAMDFAYAITPHCSPSFNEYMLSATHELIEAATDPYPLTNPASAGADAAHVGYRGEVGDLCDYGGSRGGGGFPLFGTTVERIFSNVRAKAGHDPCVPDLGLTYFGAAPEAKDDIQVSDFVLGAVKGKGVVVKAGASAMVTLDLYSERQLAPFKVVADTMDPGTNQPSANIQVSLDRDHGQNGEKLHLTITRTHKNAGGDLVFIRAVSARELWTDFIFVGD